jgi:hypothetical protein
MIATLILISLILTCIIIGMMYGMDCIWQNQSDYKSENLFDNDDETAIR